MEFIEKINQLKERAITLKDSLQTEEATKNALVMPFLNALGYDVFNPLEVVPEYIADSRLKKDEKVDYAIMQDNKPIILLECKKVENDRTSTGIKLLNEQEVLCEIARISSGEINEVTLQYANDLRNRIA